MARTFPACPWNGEEPGQPRPVVGDPPCGMGTSSWSLWSRSSQE